MNMSRFILDYAGIFFFALPIIYLSGKVAEPLALIFSVIACFVFWAQDKRGHIIFFFLLVLVLGDQREVDLLFFKQMRIVVLMVITGWTLSDLSNHRIRVGPGIKWLIPFLIISVVSLIIASPTKFLSFQKTLSYGLLILICYHFIAPWLESNKRHFMDLIHFVGLLLMIGLINYFIRPEEVLLGNRFEGVFGNPNGLGLSCMMWTPFFYIAHKQFKPNKSFYFLALFLLVSLVMSGSRNSLMTVVLFFGLQYIFKTKRRRWVVLLSIPIAYLIITNTDWIALLQRIGLSEYLRVDGIETASGRTMSWAFALTIIPRHLWLGAGFGYQEFVYMNLVPPELAIFREMSSTWNSYLTFLLNNGVIGLGLFVTFLFAQIRYTVNRWQTLAFVLAYMLGAIFETWLTASLNAYTVYFFIMIGYFSIKSSK